MSNTIENLKEFIESAKRSRKYPENTAIAIKVALRLFEAELNDEETNDIDKFIDNLDKIYHAVFERNKTKYSTSSLDTYRKRVSKLLKDYQLYGKDPAKMNSWSPVLRKTVPRKRTQQNPQDARQDAESDTAVEAVEAGTKLDWPLANGRKVVLYLPHDLTKTEAETIKQLVDLRVTEPK